MLVIVIIAQCKKVEDSRGFCGTCTVLIDIFNKRSTKDATLYVG